MESNKEFDYSRAFHSVDDWSYGYIDRKNLKSFLRKHGHLATNEEVVAIIRRMDMDADARISKQEFIESIKPEEPYSKMMKRITSSAQKRKRVSFNH
jgi:Ca2+-binding EF-hand superfamily protein